MARQYHITLVEESEDMPNLLRISAAASLALHATARLARSPRRFVSAHEMASELGVSENHLSKVCRRLARAGLVKAARGPKGGFRLNKGTDKITLLDVYETIDGPLRLDGCLLGRRMCGRNECILGGLLKSIDRQVSEYLSGTALAQLAYTSRKGEA